VLKSNLRKKLIKDRKLKKKNIKISLNSFYNFVKKYNIKNKIIGGYYPVNSEIDDLSILKDLNDKNISISLPVIGNNFNMNFYKWSFNDILYLNKYGIPEPKKILLVYPDIILVPLLAFDKRMYRLGYGGGFYDRYIEKVSKIKNSIFIGLAYSFQKILSIPNNKFDKKLNAIITEKYILK